MNERAGADPSIMLGLATGLGVWYFVHSRSERDGDDVRTAASLAERAQARAEDVLETISETAGHWSNNVVKKAELAIGGLQRVVEHSPRVATAGGLLCGLLIVLTRLGNGRG